MGSEYEKDDRRHHSSGIPGQHRRHANAGSGVRDVSDLPGTREARSELQVGQSVREEGFQAGEEEALSLASRPAALGEKPARNRAAIKKYFQSLRSTRVRHREASKTTLIPSSLWGAAMPPTFFACWRELAAAVRIVHARRDTNDSEGDRRSPGSARP